MEEHTFRYHTPFELEHVTFFFPRVAEYSHVIRFLVFILRNIIYQQIALGIPENHGHDFVGGWVGCEIYFVVVISCASIS